MQSLMLSGAVENNKINQVVFPCNPWPGSRQLSRRLPPKRPSDHFRGSGDYPLATV